MKKFLSALTAAMIAFLPFSAVRTNDEVFAEESEAVIKAETVSATPGESVDIALEISGNPGIVSLGIEISYDRECLALLEEPESCADDCGLFENAEFSPSGDSKQFPYYLSWYDAKAKSNYTENGKLAVLHFNTLENAKAGLSEIQITICEDDTCDVDLNNVSFAVENGGVSIAIAETTEPITEPVTESSTELTTETITEPVTESSAELTTETITEPVTESSTELTTEIITEPVTESSTELTTETITEPVTESSTELTTETITEPVTESSTELTTETTTEPVTEASAITTESTTEPTTNVTTTLPQTGNNKPNNFIIVVFSIMITVSGALVIRKSDIIHKKEAKIINR